MVAPPPPRPGVRSCLDTALHSNMYSMCSNMYSNYSNMYSMCSNMYSTYSNMYSMYSNMYSMYSNMYGMYSNRKSATSSVKGEMRYLRIEYASQIDEIPSTNIETPQNI